MEAAKKVRTAHRTAFTKTLNELNAMMNNADSDKEEIAVVFELLEEKMTELDESSARVLKLILEGDDVALYDQEASSSDEYKKKYLTVRRKVSVLCRSPRNVNSTNSSNAASAVNTVVVRNDQKKFKMPKFEIEKFSGNVKDYLKFWNQFRKIDEDESVDDEDKFQLLIQSMEVGSRAYELVNSYPPTRENYKKAVAGLKSRFGKDDMQVEVYVRELLSLVLHNASGGKVKLNIATLYDRLEAHMRALETFGVTSEKCAAILFPLVESSIPEEILRVWQRSASAGGAKGSKERLTALMEFLGNEVENEERINLAASGFTLNSSSDKNKRNKEKDMTTPAVPTATGLLAKTEGSNVCVFCKSSVHNSRECDKAKKFSLDERRKIIKESSCCFNCLKRGHSYKQCRVKLKCPWCSKRHVLLMCPDNASHVGKVESTTSTTDHQEHSLASFSSANMPEVYLQTLRVKMVNGEKELIVRALMDSGSQRSYVTNRVVANIGYEPIDSLDVSHILFGGVKSTPERYNVFTAHLKNLEGNYACNFKVMDKKMICGGISLVKSNDCLNELRSQNIVLSDSQYDDESIDLLIGADVAGKLLTGRVHNLKNGLTAIETHLGWTLMGKEDSSIPRRDDVLLLNMLALDQSTISDIWKLDVLGIEDPVAKESKKERQLHVKERFMETAHLNREGRYEVKLPWIVDHPPISSNKTLAARRLESTLRSLDRKNLYNDYDSIFAEWEKENIIEKVPINEIDNFSYYLPHRPVVKLSSISTKIRPVFDASAREPPSASLNQCLEPGPNLIELIPSAVLRFRWKEIGVIADIKKAFLQISVAPEERDYLRFFCDGKLIVYRHNRVVFGVTSSPFLLGGTIELHMDNVSKRKIDVPCSQDTILKLKECFYSDNCVTSVDSQQELLLFIDEATKVMQAAGFELRRWEYTGDEQPGETTVLGIVWNKETDTLSVNLSFLNHLNTEPLTKRAMLSATHRVFDPIGFTCPVMLLPKLLLQRSWKDNIDWDVELDGETRKEFLKWLKNLHLLENIKIPRKVGHINSNSNLSFHAFSDASALAYAAAVFVRLEDDGGNVELQLIGAKTRVAPTKKVSIPRLELLAATISTRLTHSLLNALRLDNAEVTYWTDSTTVLSWINREAEWSTFVWNRVQEIKTLAPGAIWRHVPGAENPADLPSRGCTSSQLLSSRWWEGPTWLKSPSEKWPVADEPVKEEEVYQEIKRTSIRSTTLLTNCKSYTNESVAYLRYFSDYTKILRMIAWMFRFVTNARFKEKQKRCLSMYVSSKEIDNAEIFLLKLIQREMFFNDKKDRLKFLNVFVDENSLIRLKTKIFYRDDEKNFRCPIVLDPSHDIVKLIIRDEHCKLGHAGSQTVLSKLREKFWIFSARRKIRSVLAKCVICQRHVCKHMESLSIPLPVERVKDAAVFEIIGVDLAGPLILRSNQKVYICIFTCAIYRAVHLELLSSLSSCDFIKGLRRFISRRGRPAIVFSDNGTNFIGVDNEFKNLNWKTVAEYSAAQRIEWRFSPPSSPWWGGWWERIVRLVKHLLRRVLGKASVNYEDMQTILCDCEAVINSRPLTYISSDCNDLMAITPSMFLQEVRQIGVPDLDILDKINLRGKFKYHQQLRESLRERFRSEYLGQIKENVKPEENRVLNLNDLVLVGNDNSKRIDWPLGRVIEIIAGRDGKARVYRVKTQSGMLIRAIQRLYPLEFDKTVNNEKEVFTQKIVDNKILENRKEANHPVRCDETDKTADVCAEYVTRSGRRVTRNRKYE